jgi:flavin reductase (DIM6/NTAB) family NADH-FMN oxidoreductase RutF
VSDTRGHHAAVTEPFPLARTLDVPLAVATVAARGEPSGCLVGSWTVCSTLPLRVIVFVPKQHRAHEVARRAMTMNVHLLKETDEAIARHFETAVLEAVDERERFGAVDWYPGPDGTPVLAGLDWFHGSICAESDAGDHLGFLLDVRGEARLERGDERQLGSQVLHAGACTT